MNKSLNSPITAEEELALATDIVTQINGDVVKNKAEFVDWELIPAAQAEIDHNGDSWISCAGNTGHYRMSTVIDRGIAIAREIDNKGYFTPAAAPAA